MHLLCCIMQGNGLKFKMTSHGASHRTFVDILVGGGIAGGIEGGRGTRGRLACTAPAVVEEGNEKDWGGPWLCGDFGRGSLFLEEEKEEKEEKEGGFWS